MSARLFTLILVLATAGWAPAAQSQSGSVTGRVSVSQAPSAPRGAARPYGRRPVREAGTEAPQRVVVWLEGEASAGSLPGLDPSPVLNQRDRQFIPRLLVIREGQTVRVLNSDPLYHNVFSLSPARRFDVGRRQTGEAVEVRFGTAGVVDVFCDIHSHMHATILVLPATALAAQEVAPNAAFRFEDVRPGTYRLRAFAPGAEPVTESITVQAGGTADAGTLILEVR